MLPTYTWCTKEQVFFVLNLLWTCMMPSAFLSLPHKPYYMAEFVFFFFASFLRRFLEPWEYPNLWRDEGQTDNGVCHRINQPEIFQHMQTHAQIKASEVGVWQLQLRYAKDVQGRSVLSFIYVCMHFECHSRDNFVEERKRKSLSSMQRPCKIHRLLNGSSLETDIDSGIGLEIQALLNPMESKWETEKLTLGANKSKHVEIFPDFQDLLYPFFLCSGCELMLSTLILLGEAEGFVTLH